MKLLCKNFKQDTDSCICLFNNINHLLFNTANETNNPRLRQSYITGSAFMCFVTTYGTVLPFRLKGCKVDPPHSIKLLFIITKNFALHFLVVSYWLALWPLFWLAV